MRTFLPLALVLLPQTALADCVYTGAKRAYITCIYDEVLTNAANIASMAANMLGFDSRLTDAEADLSTVYGGLTTLQGDLTTLQGDLTALGGSVTSLEGGLSDAHAELMALDGDLAGLQSEVDALGLDVDGLGADVADLQANAFLQSGGEVYGPWAQSLPEGNDFGGSQDGVAGQWGHFLAYSASNGGAGTPVEVSDFSFATDQWRAIFEGEWNNNFEGGNLVGLPPVIEISNTTTTSNATPNTVRVGAVTLTFSRNATSGRLQATAASSTGDQRGASFRGTITIIPHRQGIAGGQSLRLSSGIDYWGALNRQQGGSITGKDYAGISAGTYTIYRADVHGAGIVVVKLGGNSAGTCRYTELGVFTDTWSRLGNVKNYNPSGSPCPSVSVHVSGNELRVTLGAHAYSDLGMSVYGFGDLTVF